MQDGVEVLVDTNIINYILKGSKELEKFQSKIVGKQLVMSFASLPELFLWVEGEPSKEQREKINDFINDCRVIYSNIQIAMTVAKIAYEYEKRRKKSEFRHSRRWHDFWIAATAIENKLPLLTNNIKDFKWIGEKFGLNLLTS